MLSMKADNAPSQAKGSLISMHDLVFMISSHGPSRFILMIQV
jgi:hypothetical protein